MWLSDGKTVLPNVKGVHPRVVDGKTVLPNVKGVHPRVVE